MAEGERFFSLSCKISTTMATRLSFRIRSNPFPAAIRAVLGCLLLLPSLGMAAESICPEKFSELSQPPRLSSWSKLPDLKAGELPPAFLEYLLGLEQVKKLRAQYGLGKDLGITVEQAGRGGNNGWEIQADFLAQLLREIFPEARIPDKSSTRKFQGRFDLFDSTMEQAPAGLDMVYVKAANPGPILPSKKFLRAEMGLPEGDRVVSLYVAQTHSKQAGEVLKKLINENMADTIIVSTQKKGALLGGSEGTAMKPATGDLHTTDSFDYPAHPRKEGDKFIIFNETRGRMPQMHRAADHAVVLGMGNLIEPLASGTPTSITKLAPAGFSQKAWSEMLETAARTGAANSFENLDELKEKIQVSAAVIPPYRVPDANGKSPLEKLLGEVSSQIGPR